MKKLESSRRDLQHTLLCTVLESNPKKRGEPWGEKILVQSRKNWPGEAHKQPQLATQCYPRARSKERPCDRPEKIGGIRRQYKVSVRSSLLNTSDNRISFVRIS